LEYTRGFLRTVMQKFDNGQFIQNAPEKVVKRELTKKSEAEEKIRVLEERIRGLKQPFIREMRGLMIRIFKKLHIFRKNKKRS